MKVYPQVGHGIIALNTHRVREDYLQDLINFIHNGGQPWRDWVADAQSCQV